MEHYTQTSSIPLDKCKKEPHEVRIKSGSKIRTCISHVLRLMQSNKELITITGSGPTVSKAITTAEIVKRRIKGLYQQNELFYSKTEDLWEAKTEGLDKMKVTRNIPSIRITLSSKPLDDSVPGYQAPGDSDPLVRFRYEDIVLADERKHTEKRQHHGKVDKKDGNEKVAKSAKTASSDCETVAQKQESGNASAASRKQKKRRTSSNGFQERSGRHS